ncbi:uncharacterized protein HaLaN_08306 [Haematococcus lacustris]|uniref:ATP synthase mitochondrial F1 complex assembly factor 2 n=1 Tax=Haematococcus lacustris TaxID=44745 RepID=A0A699YQZ7_HAELA|nr:uncharacterized protein HaLaN_08306 [Haematococcus lacustris]
MLSRVRVPLSPQLATLALCHPWPLLDSYYWHSGLSVRPHDSMLVQPENCKHSQMSQKSQQPNQAPTLAKPSYATCVRLEPGRVAQRQGQVHDPLLKWAEETHGWHMVTSDSICGPTQSPATVQAVKHMLDGLDAWHLAAMEQLVTTCKSVIIASALAHGRLNIQGAVSASRVEEDCQVEEWGAVEAGHDLDIADIRTRIAAPSAGIAHVACFPSLETSSRDTSKFTIFDPLQSQYRLTLDDNKTHTGGTFSPKNWKPLEA